MMVLKKHLEYIIETQFAKEIKEINKKNKNIINSIPN